MIVIGTRQEHFNATWVKNEWSRFLALTKNDRRKLIIPCYSEMDAYDLPEELSMLQSQDMEKIGFIQDLIRGIKKVLSASEEKNGNNLQGNIDMSLLTPGVTQLLERTSLFLEDGNFESANQYCDRILDLEPRNAQAYFYKLLVTLKMQHPEDILSHNQPLDDYPDYQKAIRFADSTYKAMIENYNQTIITSLENERLEDCYQNALRKMESAKTEKEYLETAELFNRINEYKDSNDISNMCRVSAEEVRVLAEEAYIKMLQEKERAKERAIERDKRYKEYYSTYSEQIEIQKRIKLVQDDIKELYEILLASTVDDDKKYIKRCISIQEKKLSQFEKSLKELPELPIFIE